MAPAAEDGLARMRLCGRRFESSGFMIALGALRSACRLQRAPVKSRADILYFALGFLGADSTTGKLSCGLALAAESMLAGGLTYPAIGGADAARVRSFSLPPRDVPAGMG